MIKVEIQIFQKGLFFIIINKIITHKNIKKEKAFKITNILFLYSFKIIYKLSNKLSDTFRLLLLFY